MSLCIITATYQEANILKNVKGVHVCGIGRHRAYKKAKCLISEKASCIISLGTAAGLRSDLKAGDIVIPRKIIDHEKKALYVDEGCYKKVINRLADCPYEIRNGPLLEVDLVVSDPAKKKKLYDETGCIAADMESAGIFRACLENDIPFLCIRAILDTYNTRMPDWIAGLVDDSGRFSYLLLLKGLSSHPLDLPVLLRISISFFKASRALKYVTGRVYPSLPL